MNKMYFIWMLCFTLIACGSDSSSSSDDSGSTNNVDDIQIPEDDLVPPDNTKKVKRYTDVRVHIQLPDNWLDESMNDPGYQSAADFNPATDKSFLISNPQLVITDSSNKKYRIKLYLIPQNKISSKVAKTFVVFVTVNDIAINTVRMNSQHTAYFQKFGKSNGEARSSYRPSNGAPNDYPAIEWFGGIIKASGKAGPDVDSGKELFEQWPRTTKDPVYSPSEPSDQVEQEPIELQYLATVGMNQFDWDGIELPCCYGSEAIGKSVDTLAEQALGESNQIYNNGGTENITAKYTNQQYPQQTKAETYDFGWHGLTSTVRGTIERYHITRLNFTWERLSTDSNELIIPANGIAVSTWNTQEGSTTDDRVPPQPISTPESSLSYQINNPNP